jgi:predicted HNH restriction endonuclease
MRITVTQYKKAISELSDTRKKILLRIYANQPFDSTLDIADVLGYPNVGSVNVHVGTIGRSICKYLSITPTETYEHSGVLRPSYFLAVHEYYNDTGWVMNSNLRKAIEDLNWPEIITLDNYDRLTTEVKTVRRKLFKEGKLLQVLVSRYERDPKARKACIKLHGNKCIGCEIDFKKLYGKDIPDIIHVHHIKPLAGYQKERATDIAKDLVPLCPNCHSVVHSHNSLMSMNELKRRIKTAFKQTH